MRSLHDCISLSTDEIMGICEPTWSILPRLFNGWEHSHPWKTHGTCVNVSHFIRTALLTGSYHKDTARNLIYEILRGQLGQIELSSLHLRQCLEAMSYLPRIFGASLYITTASDRGRGTCGVWLDTNLRRQGQCTVDDIYAYACPFLQKAGRAKRHVKSV